MKTKPLILRELADSDIRKAVEYYVAEASEQVALGFVDDLERAFEHIGRHPTSGSPRFAHELNLPGLRSWPLARYPFLVFFVERDDHVDVWRVLNSHRDIPAWMREPDEA